MTPLDPWRERLKREGAVTLELRVRPNAQETVVTAAMDDGSLKVDVAEPADRGKANHALARYLADAFGVPASHVEFLVDAGRRRKAVRISL